MGTSTTTSATQKNDNQTQTPVVPSWITQPLQSDVSNITALGNVPATSYVAPQGALQTQANSQASVTDTGTNPNYTTAGGQIAANSNVGPGQIAQFMNPYTQNVLNTSNAQFDQNSGVQNAELAAQGAASGAFGGSRFGVAQGVLGGQQALARGQLDANILGTGYQSAVTSALSNAQQGLNAGIASGNLGSQEGASNIANIAQLANLGGAQQSTAQAQATAPIALAQAQTGLLSNLPLSMYTGQNLVGNLTQNTQTSSTPSALSDITGLLSGGSNGPVAGLGNLISAFAG
jgi:hypothetical protein